MNFITINHLPEISGLTKAIATLINWFPAVWLGIIMFTLLLKLVTLVLDYYSRASMRKSSLKMESMRPELEKLQKQYKDNKELYSQKVMALYKKEGYSVFGSCLPTIVTLVIFIIVLNSFNSYSEFQNDKNLYDMAYSYNSVITRGIDIDNDYITLVTDDGEENVSVNVNKVLENAVDNKITLKNSKGEDFELYYNVTKTEKETEGETSESLTLEHYSFSTTNAYIKVNYSVEKDSNGVIKTTTFTGYDVKEEVFTSEAPSTVIKGEFNNNLKVNGQDYSVYLSQNPGTTPSAFIKKIQEQEAAETYYEELEGFLWVKNIWKKDVSFDNPMIEKTDVISEESYKAVTVNLEEVKEQHNGYFILVVLTILSTFLSQFISSKSQKGQMELGTVDGQGAMTQKLMMWMMPIMMAVFAFMYSAGFSLYIITSTLLSTLTTIIINKIVDYQFKKKNNKEEINIVRRG